MGASVAGEPTGTNNSTSATLTVDIVRSGSGIPTAGWANGSGFTHYKWKLDIGSWSAAVPTTTPISLTGLANGPHFVSVSGENDAGWYQDDPALGDDALVTTSRVWTVDTSYVPPVRPTVRLNEILAANSTTLTNAGTTPDLIELYNYGAAPVDLSGMGLTTSSATPYKYIFPAATPLLGPGQFLDPFADSQNAAPGIHLGFSIKRQWRRRVSFMTPPTNGGALLDSVSFGFQVPGSFARSRSRRHLGAVSANFRHQQSRAAIGGCAWRENQRMARRRTVLRRTTTSSNCINPGSRPVALGGCFLSNAEGAPTLNPDSRLELHGGGWLPIFRGGWRRDRRARII